MVYMYVYLNPQEILDTQSPSPNTAKTCGKLNNYSSITISIIDQGKKLLGSVFLFLFYDQK